MFKIMKFKIAEKDFLNVNIEDRDMNRKFLGVKDSINFSANYSIDYWKIAKSDMKLNIIYFPASGGNLSFVVDFLNEVHLECSANIYTFNYRGYGSSKGQASVRNMLEDSALIMKHIYYECDKSIPTIIIGYSIGCFSMLNCSQDNEMKNWIKGCVLIAAHTESNIVFKMSFESKCPRLLKPFIGLSVSPELEGMNNTEYVEEIVNPTLFIVGQEDTLMPPCMLRELYEICPSRDKDIVILEGANHNNIVLGDKQRKEVVKHLKSFVNKYFQ